MNIVEFLDRDWEFDHHRAHIEGLSQYCNILCIEPPLTIDLIIRSPHIFGKWIKKKRNLRCLKSTLYVYKPIGLVPYYFSLLVPALQPLNSFIIKKQLMCILRKLCVHSPIVVVRHPAQNYVLRMLNERLLVYDVLDDYPVNYKSIKIRKLISRTDRFLQTKADIVFALTHHLVEKIKRINPNTFFIPGSADVSFFMRANDPNLPVPKDLQSIAKPRIGLIGHITDRVDMELIRFLAETHPDWSIVFIGELKGTRKFLHSLSLVKTLDMVNVHYLGFRDYTSLPNYLKGLDVCLLPYKINRDTINIYPNKLHQYFSGGKPVVSTSLPEVQYFSDVVVIAKNYEEFSDSITTYLKENNPEQVGIRIEVAKEYSVEIRGKNIFDIICENILKRG